MKQWSLFLISFVCILIMMSSYMPNPLLLIISGATVAIFGFYQIKKGTGKNKKRKWGSYGS